MDTSFEKDRSLARGKCHPAACLFQGKAEKGFGKEPDGDNFTRERWN
jgi:hypothetical protein